MDYSLILDQTLDALKVAAPVGQAIGTKVAASALWDWIKGKLQSRSAAAAEAVVDVETSPDLDANWQVLRAQLAKALAEDEDFHKELAQRMADIAPAVAQDLHITGDGNKIAQIHGNQNDTQIR